MKSYFRLQLKRVARILPFVLVVTVLLFGGFGVVLTGAVDTFNNNSAKSYTIAVTGDTDNEYMRWGIAAIRTFDDGKFSISFEEMDQSDAKSALEAGKISAYIVIPDNFIEDAVQGDVSPVTYVTSSGMESISSLFKREITDIATEIVIYAQKGSYGLGDALWENGQGKLADEHVTTLALRFTDLIFNRGELYSITESGLTNGLSTPQYYVCSVAIMMLMLIGMPFAVIFIKRDYSFNRLMISRGTFSLKQVGCEYGALVISMILQSAIVMRGILLLSDFIPALSQNVQFLPTVKNLAIKFVPIIFMVSAFNVMMFELADNIVSGLLLHFFTTFGLCYLSGCIYPLYAFPDIIQNVASFLPTGVAMGSLSGCFTMGGTSLYDASIIAYAILFFAITCCIRRFKAVKIRG